MFLQQKDCLRARIKCAEVRRRNHHHRHRYGMCVCISGNNFQMVKYVYFEGFSLFNKRSKHLMNFAKAQAPKRLVPLVLCCCNGICM